jgi:hypothetical protein
LDRPSGFWDRIAHRAEQLVYVLTLLAMGWAAAEYVSRLQDGKVLDLFSLLALMLLGGAGGSFLAVLIFLVPTRAERQLARQSPPVAKANTSKGVPPGGAVEPLRDRRPDQAASRSEAGQTAAAAREQYLVEYLAGQKLLLTQFLQWLRHRRQIRQRTFAVIGYGFAIGALVAGLLAETRDDPPVANPFAPAAESTTTTSGSSSTTSTSSSTTGGGSPGTILSPSIEPPPDAERLYGLLLTEDEIEKITGSYVSVTSGREPLLNPERPAPCAGREFSVTGFAHESYQRYAGTYVEYSSLAASYSGRGALEYMDRLAASVPQCRYRSIGGATLPNADHTLRFSQEKDKDPGNFQVWVIFRRGNVIAQVYLEARRGDYETLANKLASAVAARLV